MEGFLKSIENSLTEVTQMKRYGSEI